MMYRVMKRDTFLLAAGATACNENLPKQAGDLDNGWPVSNLLIPPYYEPSGAYEACPDDIAEVDFLVGECVYQHLAGSVCLIKRF